jgi:hypothetical protein
MSVAVLGSCICRIVLLVLVITLTNVFVRASGQSADCVLLAEIARDELEIGFKGCPAWSSQCSITCNSCNDDGSLTQALCDDECTFSDNNGYEVQRGKCFVP